MDARLALHVVGKDGVAVTPVNPEPSPVAVPSKSILPVAQILVNCGSSPVPNPLIVIVVLVPLLIGVRAAVACTVPAATPSKAVLNSVIVVWPYKKSDTILVPKSDIIGASSSCTKCPRPCNS